MIEKQLRGFFFFPKPVPVSPKMGQRGVLGWEALGKVEVWVPRAGWGDFQFPNPPARVGDPPLPPTSPHPVNLR